MWFTRKTLRSVPYSRATFQGLTNISWSHKRPERENVPGIYATKVVKGNIFALNVWILDLLYYRNLRFLLYVGLKEKRYVIFFIRYMYFSNHWTVDYVNAKQWYSLCWTSSGSRGGAEGTMPPPPSRVQTSHKKDGRGHIDFMFLGPPSPPGHWIRCCQFSDPKY